MSITALEIQEVRFGEVKRGYDPNEVDEFLERVAADVDTLNRALSEAAARIKAAETRAEEAEQRAAEALSSIPDIPIPAAEPKREEGAISEEIISKAFIAAQKSADALQEEARKEAEKLYREAEAKGRDIVREALSEKQKTLAELDRLRESSEQFRTEYLSLLKHFQADAQKRLAAFDDITAANEKAADTQKAAERLIASNDAVIPASGVAADAAGKDGRTGKKAAVAPTGAAAAYAQLEDDEELDIEEID
ncbi:MAG: DivIVA domain-containing protein [Coriobacteriales bacterium]|jgi:cell division initiation protein|nr:DivIVA domain-containing protein [Coriobacteriales bacterium]